MEECFINVFDYDLSQGKENESYSGMKVTTIGKDLLDATSHRKANIHLPKEDLGWVLLRMLERESA